MENNDLWELEFWESRNGNCPVEDVLNAIKNKDPIFHERILKRIKILQRHKIDHLFKAKDLEDLKREGLLELKIHVGNEFRMLGILKRDNFIVIYVAVHAFQKKSRKIKNKDIKIALDRLKNNK